MEMSEANRVESNSERLEKGMTIASEGIDANLFDIINYAVFALILISEGKQNK